MIFRKSLFLSFQVRPSVKNRKFVSPRFDQNTGRTLGRNGNITLGGFVALPCKFAANGIAVTENLANDCLNEVLYAPSPSLTANRTSPAAPQTFNQNVTPLGCAIGLLTHRFQNSQANKSLQKCIRRLAVRS